VEERAMPISEQTYERVALEDPDGQWELVCGRLRRKPGMTTEHYEASRILVHHLNAQLDFREYRVDKDGPRLRISTGSYYLPDVCVIPRALVLRSLETPGRFEVYEEPMPLVAEIWSPSTGEYDVEEKLREYQWRGDREIWRIHPYEKTLTRWQQQPDRSYRESSQRGGAARPVTLPSVSIDLDSLFE
jgi:Uma2 family endonuclease